MATAPEIEIRDFAPDDAEAFAALNRRWIEEHFALEAADAALFADPQAVIVDQGGAIVMACANGQALATGALVRAHTAPADGRNWWEIIKMATDPAAQGKGIGELVLRRLIALSQQRGADALWLETNGTLAAAVRLYERVGFRKLAPADCWPTPYDRCDLQLVLDL